ncbi:MAG: DNA polymerase III subunit delta [Ignavibacteriaceae bacterium]
MTPKSKKFPSVFEAIKQVRDKQIKPVYYFCGEDSYALSAAVSEIETVLRPEIASDFDKEIFYSENRQLSEVLDFAAAFPFGGGKKLLIFKEFEKSRDKKILIQYIDSPPSFTVLILVHYGKISNPESELYKKLHTNNFIFEARELKDEDLIDWLLLKADNVNKKISRENARYIIDIAGGNRNLLEVQMENLISFVDNRTEITTEDIRNLTSSMKEYNYFDLQDRMIKKNKKEALEISMKLLDQGLEMPYLVVMLTRFFTGVARIRELRADKKNQYQIASILGTPFFKINEFDQARNRYSDQQIHNAFRALLKADLLTKSTSSDPRTVLTILISEILSDTDSVS